MAKVIQVEDYPGDWIVKSDRRGIMQLESTEGGAYLEIVDYGTWQLFTPSWDIEE